MKLPIQYLADPVGRRQDLAIHPAVFVPAMRTLVVAQPVVPLGSVVMPISVQVHGARPVVALLFMFVRDLAVVLFVRDRRMRCSA